jgi:AcrR family transcriptional regulator
MTARAVTTARTATAILEATWELFEDKPFAEITLADIAARSGVTTQTVLRRFGDKDAVFAAMFAKLGTDGSSVAAVCIPTRSTTLSPPWLITMNSQGDLRSRCSPRRRQPRPSAMSSRPAGHTTASGV